MKNCITRTLFVFVLLLGSTVLANDEERFAKKIHSSGVVNEEQSILLSSNAYFYPGKKGFGLFSVGGKNREKGYIVFTENNFSVVKWSRKNKRYEVLYQDDYVDLASVYIAGNSPMLRLVTESKATGKYHSFEIMDSRNALTPNVVKTKEAHKLVTAGIKGYDVKSVASSSDLSTAEIRHQQKRMEALEARIAALEGESDDKKKQSASADCDCKCPPN